MWKDTIFLYWDQSDSARWNEETYSENRFRLMDSHGEFKGPWIIAPRKYPYQTSGTVHYNPVENRFFWTTSEYKTLYSTDPYRTDIKGKIWGYYVRNDGNFETKSGKQGWNPVALTHYFSSINTSMHYGGYAYNDSANEYFILYMLHDYKNDENGIWGIIYK